MMNAVWLFMILVAVVCALLTGQMEAVSKASVDSAKAGADLAIGLVGVMAFWIGAMLVLQRSGALNAMARLLRRPMGWLFPDVPADHPAMSMMLMNILSNMLGLGNAATPFGLKAMIELDTLNEEKGTTTDAMALFLAINTSGLAILPSGMISLRSTLGSTSAGSIIITTICASTLHTLTAIAFTKLFQRLPIFRVRKTGEGSAERRGPTAKDLDTREAESLIAASPPWVTGVLGITLLTSAVLVVLCMVFAAYTLVAGAPVPLPPGARFAGGFGWVGGARQAASHWLLPLLMLTIALFGTGRGVKVYDVIVEGGKEGFNLALRIIPFLVVILVGVGMLRASGALGMMVSVLEPLTSWVGMPAETLPMALLRPLSGTGAYALAAEIMHTHGPDSLIGNIVSTMQGSTETTFYVLALYFGVVGVRRTRHTLPACLLSDVVGLLAAVWAVRILL